MYASIAVSDLKKTFISKISLKNFKFIIDVQTFKNSAF